MQRIVSFPASSCFTATSRFSTGVPQPLEVLAFHHQVLVEVLDEEHLFFDGNRQIEIDIQFAGPFSEACQFDTQPLASERFEVVRVASQSVALERLVWCRRTTSVAKIRNPLKR